MAPGPVRTKPYRISAVVFDFDGTLTVPDALDFAAVRRAVGCPAGMGLLEFLAGLTDSEERRVKQAALEAMEMEATERTRENAGATELVRALCDLGVPLGIITRNTRESVERSLAKIAGMDPAFFRVIVTRDLPLSPKPRPDGVLYAAERLGVDAAELLVIGDYAYDIQAGKQAGALAMYLRNDPTGPFHGHGADFVVHTLGEAFAVIRRGLPLPQGKLPPDLMREALARLSTGDPSVLVGAAIGEDAAALDISEDEVLVLASDPVTLAAEELSRYAVLVNANDVATMGARPRWLLTTLLFPPGSTASEVAALVAEIHAICGEHGVALCGGHTEITDAVTRPLVVGTMAGTARSTAATKAHRAGTTQTTAAAALAPDAGTAPLTGRTAAAGRLLDKRAMQEGDRVLLTKGVAVEGTGLVAREHGARLLAAGMSADEVEQCASFLDRISILEEAGIARLFPGVSALHDVTEGGVATAVRELGAAGGRRLRLHLDRIPIYPETARLCSLLGLDPLGLIGSGSLLITCAPVAAAALVQAIASAGITVTDIGEVLGKGPGLEVLRDGRPAELPVFERDEVSRLGPGRGTLHV